MRLNAETVLLGERVILLPYKRIHVEKYHSWMKSEEIRKLTASDPLTLEEEFSMQESWYNDEDKLTFILADRKEWQSYQWHCSVESTSHPQGEIANGNSGLSRSDLRSVTNDEALSREVDCIVGDVNLFFHGTDDRGHAEIEIMIAQPEVRRRGLATEALRLMMAYGCMMLNVRGFYAKIGFKNDPSRSLFVKKLGFSETSRSEIFEEITLNHYIVEDGTVEDYIRRYFDIENFHGLVHKYSDFRLQYLVS